MISQIPGQGLAGYFKIAIPKIHKIENKIRVIRDSIHAHT
jgi:hypothetical protein